MVIYIIVAAYIVLVVCSLFSTRRHTKRVTESCIGLMTDIGELYHKRVLADLEINAVEVSVIKRIIGIETSIDAENRTVVVTSTKSGDKEEMQA